MKKADQTRTNENIRAPEVRLVDQDGNQVGIVSISVALQHAKDAALDLVEIAPNSTPPVCRIMNHGKHIFQLKKQRSDAKKKQKSMQVKEIKLRPTTDVGDYNVKLRNILRFLEEGDKVKVTLRFRGREMAHQELGLDMLRKIEEDVGDSGTVEQRPKLEGRQMMMVVAPKK